MRKMWFIFVLLCFFLVCSSCLISGVGIDAYCKKDHTPYVLINNPSARDVNYTELIAFLDSFKPEVLPSKTCGHYAEELQNYSESQGIRCAIVITENLNPAHAFNGFLTNGKMTYVDAGKGRIDIAMEGDDGLIFYKTLHVGQESNFLIFW